MESSIISARLPITSLSKEKQIILDSSINLPKFYTYLVSYKINRDFVSYEIEYGVKMNDTEVEVIRTWTRYSQLLKLYERLSRLKHDLPMFPPKKWFMNVNEYIAKYRLMAMNPFVKIINTIYGISDDELFKTIVSLTD